MKYALLFFLIFRCIDSSCHLIDSSENLIVCMDKEDVDSVGIIDGSFYRAAIQQLPICCVDVFLYNPGNQTYFLVLRKDKPAQGIYCVPGGRLYKGESFFDCARRKCREEADIIIEPRAILGVYNTIFPDSAWDCQTHTIGVAVFATVASHAKPHLDSHHLGFRWQDINCAPDHPYLKCIYENALQYIELAHPAF